LHYGMLISELEKLVDLVNESAVSGITLETEGRRVTIQKAVGRTTEKIDPVIEEQPGEELATIPELESLEPDHLTHWINAPMVGIFYHAEPPIAPGAAVEAGQIVGVIESMKLMNDIRAEENGVVKDALAEAGLAVEYGQPLFELEVG
jgi:biotin carboxyl carrier protein